MNRQQRRAAKYNRPQRHRIFKEPREAQCWQVFYPVEQIIDQIDHGEWLEIKGLSYYKEQTSPTSQTYNEILPALQGWIEFWESYCNKYKIQAPLAAWKVLENLVRENKLTDISDGQIKAVRTELNLLKRIYIEQPRQRIKEHANTIRIKLYMEDIKNG